VVLDRRLQQIPKNTLTPRELEQLNGLLRKVLLSFEQA
jgi:hypothetical protein